MNPACELCKGACCEGIAIDITREHLDADTLRYWRLHAQPWGDTGEVSYLPCPCSLLKDGKCSAHDTRPEACRVFKVGGPQCRMTVRKLRPKQWSSVFRLLEDNSE